MTSKTYSIQHPAPLMRITDKIKQHALSLLHNTTDERYVDSFGQQLTDLGDRSRWALAGAALYEWKDCLLPLLQEAVERGRKEIYKGESIADCHMVRLCYMLGYDRDHAHPTIVIACDGKRFKSILKRTVKVIQRVSELDLKGFKLLPARIPDLDFKAALISSRAKLNDESSTDNASGPHTLCGKRILVDETERHATIGGTIIVDDAYYALTVAHPFVESSYAKDSRLEISKPELFTLEWALESDDESDSGDKVDEGIAMHDIEMGPIQAGVSPHHVSTGQSATRALEGRSLRTRDSLTSLVNRPLLLSVKQFDLPLDWATMPLDHEMFFGANEVMLPSQWPASGPRTFFLDATIPEPPDGDVIILDRNRVLRVHSTASLCTGKLRNSKKDVEFWSVHCHGPLPSGICGSWALDDQTHRILGPVVAGSEILGETFIIPIGNVLRSVQLRHEASEVRFPSKEDSLWLAVYYGNGEAVARLLKEFDEAPKCAPRIPVQDPEFQRMSEDGMIMLHWSAKKGHINILKMMLLAGADVNARTKSMRTPLHFAAILGTDEASSFESRRMKMRIVENLLDQNGVDVTAKDSDGNTAVMIAHNENFHLARGLIHFKARTEGHSDIWPVPDSSRSIEHDFSSEGSHHVSSAGPDAVFHSSGVPAGVLGDTIREEKTKLIQGSWTQAT